MDGLPLTGPRRVIVEVRISWAGHPSLAEKRKIKYRCNFFFFFWADGFDYELLGSTMHEVIYFDVNWFLPSNSHTMSF